MLKNKTVNRLATSSKGGCSVSRVSDQTIRLKAINDAERKQLRIPTYHYLLP